MKFNAKYNRYVSKDGLIYRLKHGVLLLCKNSYNNCGYLQCSVTGKSSCALVHRIVYETFIGEIPNGYEIDHINCIRDDNSLCNLQLLTHAENCERKRYTYTEETRKKISEWCKGNKSLTGRHWYNNGLKNVAAFECPAGFVPGMLPRS